MKSLFRLIVLLLLLVGWGLAALSLYVVRTPEKVGILTKSNLHWRDTYVDTRTWTIDDIAKHPVLVDRLIKADKTNLLSHVQRPQDGRDLKTALQDAVASSPTTAPADALDDLKERWNSAKQAAAQIVKDPQEKH
jgi:hypothetical protein